MSDELKPIRWVGASLRALRRFPAAVRHDVGYALYLAQKGEKAGSAKPLKGIVRGAGVLEIVEDRDGDTYRTVYTVRFEGAVYVLHAFQKKSRKGIETPKQTIELIRARYAQAKWDYEARGTE